MAIRTRVWKSDGGRIECESVWTSGPGVCYRTYIVIDSDRGARGHASVDRWNGEQWHRVLDRDRTELACGALDPYDHPAQAAFLEDLAYLEEAALEITGGDR